jgi:hypothetical protein
MITLSWHAHRWRRALLLRLFIFRGDSIKNALACCVLSFGPFRRINFPTRPLLSQARTHSGTNPLKWVRAKRCTTTKTRSSASIQSGRTDQRVGLLTVYVIHTTAGAMSKHDVARRQNGPVQKLVLLLVERRYKENIKRVHAPARRCMDR